MFEVIDIKTSQRIEMVDITHRIEKIISKEGTENGICYLSVPHTTAGITINENADPTVSSDMTSKLTKLVPAGEDYAHSEGNSDSHIKSSIIGSTLTLIIDSGKLALGTWQGLYFYEFDGPRNRNLYVKVIKD